MVQDENPEDYLPEYNSSPSVADIEKELSSKDMENNYLRSRNLSLQDAAESNFMPRTDPNVIEYKLSSEELLDRIEHYLRGDILKTRIGENNQAETYYSTPVKKISVTILKIVSTGKLYIVDEHPETGTDWNVLSVIEADDLGKPVETMLEENYKAPALEEIKEALESKAKKPKILNLGYATKEIPDEGRMNLNERGVSEIMNILSMYITKETFLSWYKEDRIYEILGDIGTELNRFFLINAQQIGLNTEYKKTKYPLIVVTILHSIENAYRRALLGQENKGTRENIMVSQHQPLGQGAYPSLPPPKKKWSAFDKPTW